VFIVTSPCEQFLSCTTTFQLCGTKISCKNQLQRSCTGHELVVKTSSNGHSFFLSVFRTGIGTRLFFKELDSKMEFSILIMCRTRIEIHVLEEQKKVTRSMD
jgi:hypothetical protein